MERLTEKIDSEYCLKHCLEENPCSETSGICLCGECSFPENAYQKLGEYEDLEEQCIQENAWGLQMLLEKWKEFLEDIQHLYEYRELEGQGKLVKLPCTVGDTVYHTCIPRNEEPQIIEMKVGCVESCGAARSHKGTCEVWNVYAETDYTKAYFKFFDFGKTVFLTREEAEAALKEL